MNKIINLTLLMLLLTSQFGYAQDEESFKQIVVPKSGVWWNADQSGTGATMQFSRDGKWIVAMFLYDELGNPIFYTLQGSSIDYSFDRISFSEENINDIGAYAKVSSPVYKSENGRCFGCEYQQPNTSVLMPEVTAEIYFYQTGSAKIKFSGQLSFEEVLNNTLFGDPEILEANRPLERVVSFLGNGFDFSAIVKLNGYVSTGHGLYFQDFSCVLCEDNTELQALVDTFSVRYSGSGMTDLFLDGVLYNTVSDSTNPQGTSDKNIFAILNNETAVSNNLPTQVIIQQVIHH